jgi:cytochrome c-type protein NapB
MSARAPLAAFVLAAVLAAGCSGAKPSPTAAGADASPIPDTALGLSKGSVFDVPTPPPVKPNASAPGELPVLPRPYAMAPPRIPHAIDDFLPITPKQSSCVDCHASSEVPAADAPAAPKKPGEPTPIPASHYVDLRRAPGAPGKQIAGARWVCTACHVPRTEAEPLAGSALR